MSQNISIVNKKPAAPQKFDVEGGMPEIKELEYLKTKDPTEVYCFGDNTTILKFEVGPLNWMRIPVDNDRLTASIFDGQTRYMSSVYIPPTPEPRILLTGGCRVINGFPTNYVVEFPLKSMTTPKKKRAMMLNR